VIIVGGSNRVGACLSFVLAHHQRLVWLTSSLLAILVVLAWAGTALVVLGRLRSSLTSASVIVLAVSMVVAVVLALLSHHLAMQLLKAGVLKGLHYWCLRIKSKDGNSRSLQQVPEERWRFGAEKSSFVDDAFGVGWSWNCLEFWSLKLCYWLRLGFAFVSSCTYDFKTSLLYEIPRAERKKDTNKHKSISSVIHRNSQSITNNQSLFYCNKYSTVHISRIPILQYA